MTNLITNSEKSRGNNAVALLLPFERYVQSITNLEEAADWLKKMLN